MVIVTMIRADMRMIKVMRGIVRTVMMGMIVRRHAGVLTQIESEQYHTHL
jgi:hypothetical protein